MSSIKPFVTSSSSVITIRSGFDLFVLLCLELVFFINFHFLPSLSPLFLALRVKVSKWWFSAGNLKKKFRSIVLPKSNFEKMRVTKEMLRRQRGGPTNARLPTFLRVRRGPLPLNSGTLFPANSENLANLDGWEECSCMVRGLLFIWRVFYVLFWKHRYPGTALPAAFQAAHPMEDTQEHSNGIWFHETNVWSCDGCHPILKQIFSLFSEYFFPRLHLVDWSSHRVRVMLVLESQWAQDTVADYEIGMLLPSSLLSIILSGRRNVRCELDDLVGTTLALERAVPLAQRLCDVVAGDLLEGCFTITLLSTCRQPSKLFLMRNRRFPRAGETPGYTMLTQLRQRGALPTAGGPSASYPVLRFRRGRGSLPVQPVTPVPRHQPCFSTLPSTSGSLPARTASCCTASRHCPRCPAPLLRRRFARARASRFPAAATHRPAPRCAPRAAAVNLRRRLPRRLQHRRAVNASPAALLLNAAPERPYRLRLAAAASRNWESEDRLDSTISAFRRLFAP